jgi:hypothetical protein
MTEILQAAVLRDARHAIESARTKLVAAGLMVANGFGKYDLRVEELRKEWSRLGELLEMMKDDPA